MTGHIRMRGSAMTQDRPTFTAEALGSNRKQALEKTDAQATDYFGTDRWMRLRDDGEAAEKKFGGTVVAYRVRADYVATEDLL